MTEIDFERIRSLGEELDNMVPKEGALVALVQPEAIDDHILKANRLGQLRLGIELLKAASADEFNMSEQDSVAQLAYLDTGSGNSIFHFERDEKLKKEKNEDGNAQREMKTTCLQSVALFGCVSLFFVFIVIFLTGAYTCWRWIAEPFF